MHVADVAEDDFKQEQQPHVPAVHSNIAGVFRHVREKGGDGRSNV